MPSGDGTLKRVALHKGTTIQVCFVPVTESQTLARYDLRSSREVGFGSIFISTGKEGSLLALDAEYLRDNPDNDIPVYNGSKRIGAMKFVRDK